VDEQHEQTVPAMTVHQDTRAHASHADARPICRVDG
jgi:hypothetical protein